MATELESLLVKLGLEADDYSKGLDAAGRDTDDFVKKGGGAWDGFSAGVGIAVTDMATSAVSAIGGFAMDSLSMASDLGETTSKVQTLFGESAADIINWAEAADTSFGLTEAAALDAVGGLGNMFLQLGAGTEQAGDLSQSMVGMAADLASFHNAAGGTSEVLDTMSAAFRGEYDSVQKFIPTINAANVETKALAMTNKESAAELTAMEKALAVQAILMEDAGAATGDFARTSEGMANQQRILDAQFANIQTTLGSIFIPLATQAVSVINDFMPAISGVVEAFVEWAGALGSATLLYEDGSGHLTELLEIFGLTDDAAQDIGQTFYDLKEILTTLFKPILDLIDYFVDWQDILTAVGVVIAAAVIPALVGMVVAALPIIATFAAIIAGVALLRSAWESDFLGLRTNTQAFGSWFAENWRTWMADASEQWKTFSDYIGLDAPETMQEVEQSFSDYTQQTQREFQAFVDFFVGAWQSISSTFTSATQTIGELFNNFDWASIGQNIIEGIAGGIRDGIGWIEDAARDAANAALNAAKWALGISSPSKAAKREVGAPFSEGIGIGAIDEMETTTGSIQGALTRMVDRLSAPPVALSAAAKSGSGAPITINIYASDYDTAQRARLGLLDGLRQAGLA